MNNKKETIINGVNVVEDGDTVHFFIDNKKDEPTKNESKLDTRPWYEKLSSWWDSLKIKPYFKFRDLSDPFGDGKNDPFDDGSGHATGAEVGIQIKF